MALAQWPNGPMAAVGSGDDPLLNDGVIERQGYTVSFVNVQINSPNLVIGFICVSCRRCLTEFALLSPRPISTPVSIYLFLVGFYEMNIFFRFRSQTSSALHFPLFLVGFFFVFLTFVVDWRVGFISDSLNLNLFIYFWPPPVIDSEN